MGKLILFNKPYGVLCQFRAADGVPTLADYIDVKKVYPAGRLDKDSEGLVILTDDGSLQARISHPRFKQPKTYWTQVEGVITEDAMARLRAGVVLGDGKTRSAVVSVLTHVNLPARQPPIRVRKSIPDSWVAITLTEGKNRQVRRMTAAVGFPTLRLFRYRIGDWNTDGIQPGDYRLIDPGNG
ncbi:MAG: pseudouridine synthase [Pseudomonadales bacterium]